MFGCCLVFVFVSFFVFVVVCVMLFVVVVVVWREGVFLQYVCAIIVVVVIIIIEVNRCSSAFIITSVSVIAVIAKTTVIILCFVVAVIIVSFVTILHCMFCRHNPDPHHRAVCSEGDGVAGGGPATEGGDIERAGRAAAAGSPPHRPLRQCCYESYISLLVMFLA